MTNKKHISASERDKIGVLLASGNTQNSIAKLLGRSKSSISYEIRVNSRNGVYQPILANYLSQERNLKSQKQHAKKDPRLYSFVITKLREGWSPTQMGREMGPAQSAVVVIQQKAEVVNRTVVVRNSENYMRDNYSFALRFAE